MNTKPPLVWNSWNIEHIKKHAVSTQEVEEVYLSLTKVVQSYQERFLILGKTKAGRKLTFAVSYQKQAEPYVVSARDMSKKERKIYEQA